MAGDGLAMVPLPSAVPQACFGGDGHRTGGTCCCRALVEENGLLSVKTLLDGAGILPATAVASLKHGKTSDFSWSWMVGYEALKKFAAGAVDV